MTISPRERMLLILLSAVIILVGGSKLLISPQLEKLSELAERRSEAQFLLQQAELDLLRARTIDQETRALESKIVQDSARFFPTLTNDMVQVYFDNLARAAGVTISSFSMSPVTAAQVANPAAPGPRVSYPAGDAALRLAQQEAPAATPSRQTGPQDGLVELMEVSVQLRGSYAQALALLGQVSGTNRTLRVASVYLASQADGTVNIHITAQCYGVAKFAGADSLSVGTLPHPEGQQNPF